MASSKGGMSGKSIVGGPPAADQHDLRASQWGELVLRERMPQVAEEDHVQVLGPEVDDRHLVLGLPLGGLEHVDRLEPDALDHLAPGRQLERTDHLERRNDLARGGCDSGRSRG